MRPGQDLDRLDSFRVSSDRPVVVAVGADHVGQDLGVTGIGLRSRGRVPIPIPRGRHRIHREHQVPGRHQCGNEQAPVGLDSDHHLIRLDDVVADEVMEAGDALHAVGQPAPAKAFAVLVLHVHIVVGLSPVHSYENHLAPLSSTGTNTRARGPSSSLMDQCSKARHPTSRHGNLTDQQGHDLGVELEALRNIVLTC